MPPGPPPPRFQRGAHLLDKALKLRREDVAGGDLDGDLPQYGLTQLCDGKRHGDVLRKRIGSATRGELTPQAKACGYNVWLLVERDFDDRVYEKLRHGETQKIPPLRRLEQDGSASSGESTRAWPGRASLGSRSSTCTPFTAIGFSSWMPLPALRFSLGSMRL